jgi:hypothetical protein
MRTMNSCQFQLSVAPEASSLNAFAKSNVCAELRPKPDASSKHLALSRRSNKLDGGGNGLVSKGLAGFAKKLRIGPVLRIAARPRLACLETSAATLSLRVPS